MFRGVVLALALGAMGCGRVGFDSLLGGDNTPGDNTPGDDNPGDSGVQMDAAPLGTLGDPNGYWQFDQFVTANLLVHSRADIQNGGRANWRIQGNGLEARDALFTGGYPSIVRTGSGGFSSTMARWTVADDLSTVVTVYDVTWVNAGHVSLTANPGAPGASGTPVYMTAELTRIPAPPISSGVKTYTRFQYEGDIERPAGDCMTPTFLMGMHWEVTGSFTLTQEYTFDHDEHQVVYSDAGCTAQTQVVDEQIDAAYLELGATTYESWADVNQAGHRLVHSSGTLEVTPTRVRFTQTACDTDTPPCLRPILVEMTR